MSVRRLDADQPAESPSAKRIWEWAKQQIAKFPEGRQWSAVIPLLWRAQEQAGGWLPEPAIRAVGEMLDMPYIRVYEIANILHHVQSLSGRNYFRTALRHDAMHVARRGGAEGGLPEDDRAGA